VTLLNIHESVRFKSGGVRFYGILPVYNYEAAIGSAEVVAKRQLELYHDCMSIVSEELREFCLQPCTLLHGNGNLHDVVPRLAFIGSDYEQVRHHVLLTTSGF
jgi:hypothetical protein